MRRKARTLAGLGFLLLAAVAQAAACFNYEDDPALCFECRGKPSGGGGTGGSAPPGCVPSASAGSPVSDDCGVFVAASGSDGGSGTKAAPVATLAKAIELAEKGSLRVYACADELTGSATVPAGLAIFGGLDCAAGWAYVGDSKPTRLAGPPDQIALVLAGGSGTTRLEDLHVVAGDASNPGGSSIAALADGGDVELARCTFEAGSAMAGADGEAPVGAAASGLDGNAGGDACSASIVLPGDAVVNACSDATESVGGNGGIGSAASGGDGSTGLPSGSDNGGAPEQGAVACTNGLAGDAGADGAPGAGGTDIGTIDSNGYTGVLGAPGMPGAPGQGGGGGGGSKGGSGAVGKCPDSTMAGGASGGSGASGGCGGAGGKPGGPGGSSIALISVGAKLAFTDVALIAKNGGPGGAGALGQDGGLGGAAGGPGGGIPAGSSLKPGCAGGSGGSGGRGGPGGNGSGGHSLGIAFTGAAPSTDGATITVGQPGNGGTAADPAGAGAEGKAAPTQEFP